MLIGTISDYNNQKGYGFIKEGNKNKLFVHSSSIQTYSKHLRINQKVEYEVAYGAKGPQAVKVNPLTLH